MATDERATGGEQKWSAVRSELRELFGEDADLTVHDRDDHLDVRVIPTRFAATLESEHDVTVVPYSPLRMTIRRNRTTTPE